MRYSVLKAVCTAAVLLPGLITGASAQERLDRMILPIQQPEGLTYSELGVRDEATAPRFEVKAENAPNVVVVLNDGIRFGGPSTFAGIGLVDYGLALAQAENREFEAAPILGYTVPISDIAPEGGTAFGLQGLYYPTPRVGVGLAVIHNRFELGTSGARLGMTEITIVGKVLILDGPIAPYGKVAAGVYANSLTGSNQGEVESGTVSALGGGSGVQWRISGLLGVFAEGMLMVEGLNDSFLGLRLGSNICFGGGS